MNKIECHSAAGEKIMNPAALLNTTELSILQQIRDKKTDEGNCTKPVPEPLYDQEPPSQYLPETTTGRREQCPAEMGNAKQSFIATDHYLKAPLLLIKARRLLSGLQDGVLMEPWPPYK